MRADIGRVSRRWETRRRSAHLFGVSSAHFLNWTHTLRLGDDATLQHPPDDMFLWEKRRSYSSDPDNNMMDPSRILGVEGRE